MSPIEIDPDGDWLPDPVKQDLATAVRAFVDAALSGHVTQSATIHAWARKLEKTLGDTPAQRDKPRRWE